MCDRQQTTQGPYISSEGLPSLTVAPLRTFLGEIT
jgi:hypothetical protein